jgi:plasmid replication initiation protein
VTSRRYVDSDQLDLFIPFITDLAIRDQRDTMERPCFSLAKSKRLKPIDYTSPDGSVWVKVIPHQSFGMATIWDADILIWAASLLTDMKNRRVNEIPRQLRFQPYDLLKAIHRPTGGKEYRYLRDALDRLKSTVVKTNIRGRSKRKDRTFSWIDDWGDLVDEKTEQSVGMEITVSDWFYEGVLMEGGVLAIDPVYFSITSGRERWLYRVARKHAGGHGWLEFAILIPTLFEKSGAEGTYRRFKFEIKRIAKRNALPEFFLAWEEREGEEPSLRMVRRSALAVNHPGFEVPRQRLRRVAARS